MRRMLLATLAAAACAAPAAAGPAPLVVRMDQATRVMLSRPARDVVIANPLIADVTVLDSRSLVVLGKAVGTTSLLVVDPAGRTVADRQIIVSASDDGRMSFYRGPGGVLDFACSPRCGRVVPPGGNAAEAAAPQESPAP